MPAMRSRLFFRTMILFFLLFFFCGMAGSAVFAESQEEILPLLYQARDFYKSVDSYTCVFIKQERLDGKLREPETISLKFAKPFKVYMKWIQEPNKGRELIFVPGRYDNKLKVHIGGFLNLFLPAITIAPDSPHVMKNTRHPITQAGIGNMLNSMIDQFELAQKQGDLRVTIHGTEKVLDVECVKIERTLPKDKGYYCYRLILYLNVQNHLPVKIMVYDWNNVLIEAYAYTQMRWNAGLTDKDFDDRNKEYSF